MIVISIRDFVLTGDFGPVNIGCSLEMVRSRLGAGREIGRGKYCYGSFEFFFDSEEILTGIQNSSLHPAFGHFDNHRFENDHFSVDPWLLSAKVLRLSSVLNQAYAEGIPFTVGGSGTNPELEFSSGVKMKFDIHEHHGRIGSRDHAELYALSLGQPG